MYTYICMYVYIPNLFQTIPNQLLVPENIANQLLTPHTHTCVHPSQWPAGLPGALSYVVGATHCWSTAELDGGHGRSVSFQIPKGCILLRNKYTKYTN